MSTISYRPSVRRKLKPSEYILEPGLKNAVEIALALDQPLLLTGEPGTGKTQLAYKAADDLYHSETDHHQFSPKVLRFNTKTTSSAQDLFYTYDALGHFQSANIKREAGAAVPHVSEFITLEALGLAYAAGNLKQLKHPHLIKQLEEIGADKFTSSVVLIDEVDKAPRDFTNDLLNQIENHEFNLRELGQTIERSPAQRTLIILTSNSEKNLPDAFLRRCVFYHIPFPSPDLLKKIITSQVEGADKLPEDALNQAVDFFNEVRENAIRKKPATAEFIAWMRLLGFDRLAKVKDKALRRELMRDNLSILVKTKEDLEAIQKI